MRSPGRGRTRVSGWGQIFGAGPSGKSIVPSNNSAMDPAFRSAEEMTNWSSNFASDSAVVGGQFSVRPANEQRVMAADTNERVEHESASLPPGYFLLADFFLKSGM